MVSKRYAKANNPLLPDYDPSKPKKYITYYDANNLYGWVMSKPLPPKKISNENVLCRQRRRSSRKKRTQGMAGFLRLILNNQQNCMRRTTAILWLRRKRK